MIRVLIDAVAPGDRPRGVGRYVTKLANALSDDADLSISIAVGPWQLREFEAVISSNVQLITAHPPSGGRVGRHLWHRFALEGIARRVSADLIHLPDTLPVPSISTPIIATIHDLAEFDLPEAYGTVQGRYRRRVATRAVYRADRLITVSEFSRQRIETIFPRSVGSVAVIPNGPGIPPDIEPVKPAITISPRFLLFVGALNRNKNLGRLVAAFVALAQSDVDLVIAGPAGNDAGTVTDAITGARNIKWLEGGSDAELAWLYSRAQALVMPSLYEGFGLPIVEAMAFGTPVITSRAGATLEVTADAGLLIDPLDAKAIRDAMARILADHDLQRRLASLARRRAPTFSWIAAARMTSSAYRAAAAHSRTGQGH